MDLRDARVRMHDQNRSAEDWRRPAQIDADRVWYSPEFRRLEGVTQVVPPQDDYVFHDRLTHSVKVAQVAATLARRLVHLARSAGSSLEKLLAAHELEIHDWVDPDYCYVAGLAHDIGHPPYGHAGEAALQRVAERHGGDLGERSFEGNAQSTRIVASLSFRKPRVDGLDLTLRALAAIAKYPWLRGEHPSKVDKLAKKWSFYEDERPILEELRRYGFVKEVKQYLTANLTDANDEVPAATTIVEAVYRWPEAEIMDWADDISYAVHDLEDFYRAGRIPLHRITSAFSHVPKQLLKGDEDARAEWFNTSFYDIAHNDDEVRGALKFARAKMMKTLSDTGELLSDYVPDAFIAIHNVLSDKMPSNRFDGTRESHTDLQRFASEAITYLSEKTELDVVEVEGEKRLTFRVDPTARVVAEFFKAICQFYVIESSALATMQFGQTLSLERMGEALVDMTVSWLERRGAVSQQHSLPSRLSEYVKARASLSGVLRGEIEQVERQLKGALPDLERAELEQRYRDILAEERGQIMICVFDYLCGLRDMQTSILEERLFGNRSSLSLASTWLDV